MPSEVLPFTSGEASSLEQLGGAPPLMVNSLTDIGGTRRSRPGIAVWGEFPEVIPNASPVDAMTVFGDKLVYVTRDRALFAWTGDGVVVDLSDATLASQLDGGARPQLLSTHSRVIAVGSGAPQKWDGITALSQRLGGSPPPLSFVAGLATRLVGNYADESGIFVWSGLGEPVGHESWDALDYAEAEARPDKLIAVADNANELFAFGEHTLQVYIPDATVGFASSRALNVGLGAPYSLIKVDDMFAFFDDQRRFLITDGRTFSDEQSVLSKPIESRLRGLTVSDCWGFRMRVDRWDACVWMFPTDGMGYIWDRRGNAWSEWRLFDDTGYGATRITSAVAWPEKNLFLVGLETGQIAKLDASAFTDLGNIIKVELVTGFVDHGTDNLKKCVSAKFIFRRGQQTDGAPVIQISYRDDLGAYCTPSTFTLGAPGGYDATLEMRSEGTYRRRQWRLEFTSAAEFSFIGAREDFEPLGN